MFIVIARQLLLIYWIFLKMISFLDTPYQKHLIQPLQKRYRPLQHKHCGNRVTLTKQKLTSKCCKSLGQTILYQKGFRPFQRGTMDLFKLKGHKVTKCQSWMYKRGSVAWQESNHFTAAWVRVLDDWIMLKVWWTIIL